MDKEIQKLIRDEACAVAAQGIAEGALVLPLEYAVEARQGAEEIRAGKRKLKTLKSWKTENGNTRNNVLVFGDLVVTVDTWKAEDKTEHTQYCVYERCNRKRLIWGKHEWNRDLYDFYAFVIHLSLIITRNYESLPTPEKLGVDWKLTLLTWETGQTANWEIWHGMRYALRMAAVASNNFTEDTL